MKFKTSSKTAKESLAYLSRVAGAKSTFLPYTYITVECDIESVRVSARNNSESITVEFPAIVEKVHEKQIMIPLIQISAFVGLSNGDVSFEKDGEKFKCSYGSSVLTVPVIADVAEPIPCTNLIERVRVSLVSLKDAMGAASICCRESSYPFSKLLAWRSSSITATDGRSVSMTEIDKIQSEIVFPVEFAKAICSIKGRDDQVAVVENFENSISMQTGNILMTCIKDSNPFPSMVTMDNVIPKDCNCEIKCNTQAMTLALESCMRVNPLGVSIRPFKETLEVRSKSLSGDDLLVCVPLAANSFPHKPINLNTKYLLDAIKVVRDAEAVISRGADDMSPLVIKHSLGTLLLMPIRIS